MGLPVASQDQGAPDAAQPSPAAFTHDSRSPRAVLLPVRGHLPQLSVRAVALLGAFYSPAFAQDRHEWPSHFPGGRPAYVELGPATDPDAIATLTFVNENVHQGGDTFTLSHDGLTVAVTLEWNVTASGDEAVSVTVPPGYRAEPDRIQVQELRTGVIQIFPMLEELM